MWPSQSITSSVVIALSSARCGVYAKSTGSPFIFGPQTRPFILYPDGLALGDEPLVGAAAVHRLLKRWRRALETTEGTELEVGAMAPDRAPSVWRR